MCPAPSRVLLSAATIVLLAPAHREAAAADKVARPVLGESEFSRLHALLEPPEEAWRGLAWEASLLDARDRAARERKPVYMLVRSGNPLGCV